MQIRIRNLVILDPRTGMEKADPRFGINIPGNIEENTIQSDRELPALPWFGSAAGIPQDRSWLAALDPPYTGQTVRI